MVLMKKGTKVILGLVGFGVGFGLAYLAANEKQSSVQITEEQATRITDVEVARELALEENFKIDAVAKTRVADIEEAHELAFEEEYDRGQFIGLKEAVASIEE
jgi:LPS O-antigen subunit length determinant protein (WzzB/FepE family)